MPKAAMHKYHGFMAGKHNIWFARQILAVKSEPQAQRMYSAPQRELWRGVR
jgi:hypothetical protein